LETIEIVQGSSSLSNFEQFEGSYQAFSLAVGSDRIFGERVFSDRNPSNIARWVALSDIVLSRLI
jgi:hypothetical protein